MFSFFLKGEPVKTICGQRSCHLVLEPLEDRHLLAISLSTLDDFEDGTTQGWMEGAASANPPTNVPDGGPDGAGDNFLRNVSVGGGGPGGRQAVFNVSQQWIGNYITAGVTRIDAQLANFGTSPLAMRIAIATGPSPGPDQNSWYASANSVNLPADGVWHDVSFGLESADLTLVQGADSLAAVLANVTEIRILSSGNPDFRGDPVAATLGADDLRAGGAANMAPSVITTNSPLTYRENDAATRVDPGLTVVDSDSPSLVGARVSITGGLAANEDVLGFSDQLGISGSFDAAVGVLTLSGTASVGNYQTALRSVTYTNTSDNPSTARRAVTFLVDDGATTASAMRDINLSAVNDIPVINTTTGSLDVVPNQGPAFLDSGLTVTDVDDDALTGATVSITSGFVPGEDGLGFADQLGITGDFDAATGMLTLSGTASLEDYQSALRSVTYDNTNDNPNTDPRMAAFEVNDGDAKATAVRNIHIGEFTAADFGDAPDSYPTTLARDGASHLARGPQLGNLRDSEADGQPTATADGDDLDGTADEDGVTVDTILVGQTSATVTVTVQVPGAAAAVLDAWIDFNSDGTWQMSERIADSLSVTNHENVVTFDVPTGAAIGTTVARFRLSTDGNLEPNGPADDGEVEDHLITISSWHNFANPFDVNGADGVSPLDALLIINELTSRMFSDPMTGRLDETFSAPPYLDVTNDGIAAPLDALLVINELPSSEQMISRALPDATMRRFTPGRFIAVAGVFGQRFAELCDPDAKVMGR